MVVDTVKAEQLFSGWLIVSRSIVQRPFHAAGDFLLAWPNFPLWELEHRMCSNLLFHIYRRANWAWTIICAILFCSLRIISPANVWPLVGLGVQPNTINHNCIKQQNSDHKRMKDYLPSADNKKNLPLFIVHCSFGSSSCSLSLHMWFVLWLHTIMPFFCH